MIDVLFSAAEGGPPGQEYAVVSGCRETVERTDLPREPDLPIAQPTRPADSKL